MMTFFGIHTANVVYIARTEAPGRTLQPYVPRVELDVTGVEVAIVTEKGENAPATRAEDIKSDELD